MQLMLFQWALMGLRTLWYELIIAGLIGTLVHSDQFYTGSQRFTYQKASCSAVRKVENRNLLHYVSLCCWPKLTLVFYKFAAPFDVITVICYRTIWPELLEILCKKTGCIWLDRIILSQYSVSPWLAPQQIGVLWQNLRFFVPRCDFSLDRQRVGEKARIIFFVSLRKINIGIIRWLLWRYIKLNNYSKKANFVIGGLKDGK